MKDRLMETVQAEATKRERAFDPAQRWKVLQETITWTEQQLRPEERRNRPRLPLQLMVAMSRGRE